MKIHKAFIAQKWRSHTLRLVIEKMFELCVHEKRMKTKIYIVHCTYGRCMYDMYDVGTMCNVQVCYVWLDYVPI